MSKGKAGVGRRRRSWSQVGGVGSGAGGLRGSSRGVGTGNVDTGEQR